GLGLQVLLSEVAGGQRPAGQEAEGDEPFDEAAHASVSGSVGASREGSLAAISAGPPRTSASVSAGVGPRACLWGFRASSGRTRAPPAARLPGTSSARRPASGLRPVCWRVAPLQ